MLRCLRPGCPTRCGIRRKPSCADRVLHYALLSLLAAALLISLAVGLASLGDVAADSRRASESAPIAVLKTLELTGKTEDDGRERIGRDRDGKSELRTDAPVQIPEQC